MRGGVVEAQVRFGLHNETLDVTTDGGNDSRPDQIPGYGIGGASEERRVERVAQAFALERLPPRRARPVPLPLAAGGAASSGAG